MSISPALKEALAANVLGGNKGLHLSPFFISGMIDSLLMGVVVCQTFTYSQFVKRDRKHVVAIVFLAVITTTMSTGLITAWMLRLFVAGFGTYLPFTEVFWLARCMGVEIAAIFLAQTFYLDRACRLYAHWFPAAIIGPFVLGTAILGSISLRVLTVNFENITLDAMESPASKALAYTWLSLIMTTDCLITAIISYGLYRVKSGYAQTDSIIKNLILRCFETQTPAFISSAICMIAWNRQFEIALLFVVLQTKVYTLGLLLSLNLRVGGTTGETKASHRSTSFILPSTSSYALSDMPTDRQRLDVSIPDDKSGWEPNSSRERIIH